MSVKRYVANADTTITNAYKTDLVLRGTGSNMGASDSMEIFSLYGQVTSASLEQTRALVKFPITSVVADRTNSVVPASGSVKFFVKLYNAQHPFSLPKDYYVSVHPVSQSWDEGYGLDMENYSDPGHNVKNGFGANWEFCVSGSRWQSSGSSFLTASYDLKQYFLVGDEDLEIDVTDLVEQWVANSVQNNGLVVKLSGAFEDGSLAKSFYTKKFFTRGTEYFFKKPILEARWEDAVKDDRGVFYSTSSLLSEQDNYQNIYFYNRHNGKLKNIPGDPTILVKFYSNEGLTNEVPFVSCSVSNPSAGIYKAAVLMATTASALYDKWYNSSSVNISYYQGSFDVNTYTAEDYNSNEEYVFAITNLKTKYNKDEKAKIKIFSRLRDWSPNIYSIASKTIENTPIKNLFYKIFRIEDGYTVFDYSTGSLAFTKTSYDSDGNYFDFDMSMLEPDNTYAIQLARFDGSLLEEYKQVYKFRVE